MICFRPIALVLVVAVFARGIATFAIAQTVSQVGPPFVDSSHPHVGWPWRVLKLDESRFLAGFEGAVVLEETLGGGYQVEQALVLPPIDSLHGLGLELDGDSAVVTTGGYGSDNIFPFASAFERIGGQWTRIQMISSPWFLDSFGVDADLEGDLLVIGEPEPEGGAVWCFRRTGGAWEFLPTQGGFEPHNGTSSGIGGRFGTSLDLDEGRLLVGQPYAGVGANLYSWNEATLEWDFETVFGQNSAAPTGTTAPFGFGVDVALDGSLAVVGSSLEAPGAVYVYEHDGSSWSSPLRLTAPTLQGNWNFGNSVDIDEASGRLIVGDFRRIFPSSSGPPLQAVGSAYVFHRVAPSQWVLAEILEPALLPAGLEFGTEVQINDRVALCSSVFGVYVHTPLPNLASGASALSTCHGDGGDQLGCVDCPCGNNSAPGTVGGCSNSTGRAARLRAGRSLSVSLNELEFVLEGGGLSTFALLGSGTALAPLGGVCPPGSGVSPMSGTAGLRCVSGVLARHGVVRTDGDGNSAEPWTGVIEASGFQSGQTHWFQAIYRDEFISPCGSGQSTTQALNVTLQP